MTELVCLGCLAYPRLRCCDRILFQCEPITRSTTRHSSIDPRSTVGPSIPTAAESCLASWAGCMRKNLDVIIETYPLANFSSMCLAHKTYALPSVKRKLEGWHLKRPKRWTHTLNQGVSHNSAAPPDATQLAAGKSLVVILREVPEFLAMTKSTKSHMPCYCYESWCACHGDSMPWPPQCLWLCSISAISHDSDS